MPDLDEPKKKDSKDLVARVRRRVKAMIEGDRENRQRAMDDIKFARVAGHQWDETTKKERGKDRLMLEFPKVKTKGKRIINDMRGNRPQGKVRGYEDNDRETAETLEGLVRNICNVSDMDSITDYQAEYQVFGGYGCWEIVTDYSDDSVFDQDIEVRNIANPFCVWFDPAATDILKRDAMDCAKLDKITKAAYKERWPNKEIVNFESDGDSFDDEEEWAEEGEDGLVRIAEYWYKVPTVKRLALLQDGKTVDLDVDNPPPEMILKTRDVKCHKVMMAICSGEAVLEQPREWAGKYLPFVPVYGDYIVIDGKVQWSGIVVDVKDAQRAYNSHRTAIVESVESHTQAKTWLTAKEAEGHESSYAEAHKKNFPIAYYNDVPNGRGPIAIGGADVPVALIQSAQIASEEIDSLIGFEFDPSGADAKNISGKALNTRVRQGQITTYNYPDNMGKSVQYTWEILLDLVPKIYDTQRAIRILGADGAEKFVKVNVPGPDGQIMNDLSRGKYDVTVTIGPSYATQRQESAEVFTEIGRAVPQIWGIAGDLMVKNMDLPGADQIAKRLEFMLPPPIQKSLQEGKEIAPEVQQAMMQVEQMAMQIQEQWQLVQQAAAEAEKEKSDATKAKADVQIAEAKLKVEEANFQTMQANFEKLVAQTEAKLQKTMNDIQMSELQHETDKADAEKVGNAANMALEQIQALSEAIKAEFSDMLGTAAQVVMAAKEEKPKPRPVKVTAKRVNGQLVGDIQYDDGTARTVSAANGPDGMTATVQ